MYLYTVMILLRGRWPRLAFHMLVSTCHLVFGQGGPEVSAKVVLVHEATLY